MVVRGWEVLCMIEIFEVSEVQQIVESKPE